MGVELLVVDAPGADGAMHLLGIYCEKPADYAKCAASGERQLAASRYDALVIDPFPLHGEGFDEEEMRQRRALIEHANAAKIMVVLATDFHTSAIMDHFDRPGFTFQEHYARVPRRYDAGDIMRSLDLLSRKQAEAACPKS